MTEEKPAQRRVPLSPRSLEIVESMLALHGKDPKSDTLLFPGLRLPQITSGHIDGAVRPGLDGR